MAPIKEMAGLYWLGFWRAGMPAGHGWPAILAGLPADAGAGWLAGAGAGAGHMAGHMACHIRAKLEPSWGQVGAKLEPSWEAQEAPTSNFWQISGKLPEIWAMLG